MDLIFQKYASPFLILEQMLGVGRFNEFVSEFIKIRNQEKEDETVWEYYLHHSFLSISFEDFKIKCGIKKESEYQSDNVDFETIVKNTVNILDGFAPE